MVRDGLKTVAAAGIREALTPGVPTLAAWVEVQAFASNTNAVVVGGRTCVASSIATQRGIRLLKGDAFMFPWQGAANPYDLSDIWVDVVTNGEGVSFVYGRN